VIWYLSGVTFAGSAFGPTIASGYELMGTADFNGGGSPDYVLYNPSTPANSAVIPEQQCLYRQRRGSNSSRGLKPSRALSGETQAV
jgi:hypothetical protein